MSRSNVEIGAPLSTAATPPTMIMSTRCLQSTSSASLNLIIGSQRGDAADEALQYGQSLLQSERKHPADQRDIHAVVGFGFAHAATISRACTVDSLRGSPRCPRR